MTSQLGEQAQVARATARFVRVTPMKARRVVDLVRYLPADEALALLRFAPQSASEPVAKVVASAVANAEHNLRLDPEALVISAAYVDEGPTLKRIRPRAQGRAVRINKRTSHITIEVSEVATSDVLAHVVAVALTRLGRVGEPARAVVGGDAQAVPERVDFLSHYRARPFVSRSATTTVMWLVRLRIWLARPCARGRNRLSVGPSSTNTSEM